MKTMNKKQTAQLDYLAVREQIVRSLAARNLRLEDIADPDLATWEEIRPVYEEIQIKMLQENYPSLYAKSKSRTA